MSKPLELVVKRKGLAVRANAIPIEIRLRLKRRPRTQIASAVAMIALSSFTVAVLGGCGPSDTGAGKSARVTISHCGKRKYEFHLHNLTCSDALRIAGSTRMSGPSGIVIATRGRAGRELRGAWSCDSHPASGWMRCTARNRGFARVP